MELNNKEGNRFSLKAKLSLMTSLIMIVSIVVVSAICYGDLYKHTTNLLQQQALSVAKSAVRLIDGDEFERISLSLDSNDTYYEESLGILKDLNKDIGQGMLYTIVNQDQDYYTYVIDGSGTVEIGHKQVKSDFSKEAALAFKEGKSYFCEPYSVETFNKYYISAFVPIFNSQNQVVGVMEYDYEGAEIAAITKEMLGHIIKATVVLISCSLIINYLVLKRLFKPIEKLIETIEVIAKGDLTIELTSQAPEEIKQIHNALNKTVYNIRGILEKIKEASKKVTVASKSILVTSKDASEVYEELAVSTMKIVDTTQKQIDVSKKVECTLEELQQDIQSVYEKVDKNKKEYARMDEIASQSIKGIEEVEKQISHIESRLALASQVSSQISNHINGIQDMIMTILRISEQTTLLALTVREQREKKQDTSHLGVENVEALIKQSHLATKEIKGIIGFIDEQLGAISCEIKESTKQVELGLKATVKSKDALITICDNSKVMGERANQAYITINEILDKSSSISESVRNIGEVSTYIDSSTMNLLAITEEQVATSDEFKTMAKLLREQAKLLDDSISRFKV